MRSTSPKRIDATPLRNFHRHILIALFALAGATILSAATATAADFASDGAPGTLTVKVTAVGGAKYNARPRAGLDAREWKINNAAQFSIKLRAIGAVGDASPENQANAAAARDAYQQTVTDKDQAAVDALEKKMEACGGNPDCENRVLGQMAGDAGFLSMMQKMQGTGPAMVGTMRGVDVAPSQQVWMTDPMDTSPASGTVKLDVTEKVYGVVDAGGKADVTCRWNTDQEIKPGSPESKVGASVIIDSKTSTYEIRIPADAFSLRLAESCSDSKTGSHGPSKNMKEVSLIGRSPPRGVKNFAHLLTFKGPIGSSNSPQLGGKETVTTDWINANSPEPIPVKVTIEWQFSAVGR